VIATTLRLWWQRHVYQPSRNAVPGRRTLRLTGIAVLVIALIVASVTAINLARTRAGAIQDGSRPTANTQAAGGAQAPGAAGLAAATASRQHAAAWIAAQVGRDVIVACDPLMCTALQQQGFPAANLATIGPGAGDPLGSGIVVSTVSVRSQLGTRLTSVYATQVIASFGTGQSLVQILVTAAGGVAAYKVAEQADFAARKTGGRDLLGNSNVFAFATPRMQLAAGLVDSRLLLTLAALAHRYPVQIRGFGDSGPGAAPGTPFRSALMSSTSTSYLSDMLAFLRAQRAPLLAMTAEHHVGTTTVIQIEFTAPSPVGLLSQS
jgi:hypothetical protein